MKRRESHFPGALAGAGCAAPAAHPPRPSDTDLSISHTRWRREVYEDGEWVEMIESQRTEAEKALPIERFVSRRRRRNGVQRDVFEYWLRDDGATFNQHFGKRTESKRGEVPIKIWVALTWAEVVGSEDPQHVRAGTQCHRVRTTEGVMSYASKYIGKVNEEDAGACGRWWGMFNRGFIPWGEVERIELPPEQAHRLRRVALRYINSQRRATGRHKMRLTGDVGMKVFCRADDWCRNLPQLVAGGG